MATGINKIPLPNSQLCDPETGIIDQYWYDYFAGLSSAQQAQSGGPITQAKTNDTFWNPNAFINRFHGRSFFGPAEEQTGDPWPPVAGDWLTALTNMHYNGGDGVTQNGLYAQTYFLNDITTPNQPGTLLAPTVAAIFGTSNIGQSNGTSYPIGTVAVNDSAGSSSAWGLYTEAHHVGGGTGNTFGAELEIRNSRSFVYWDPFNVPGPYAVNLLLAAGAGLSATGQFDAVAALAIGANPMKFGTGIMFFTGGIGAHGPGGSISAISMPKDYAIQWFSGAGTPSAQASSSSFSIANGANAALIISQGFLVVTEVASGAAAIYLLQGGTVSTVSLGAGVTWVNSTTTPAAGKMSVAWSGTDTRIYNNKGSTVTVNTFQVNL